MVIVVGAEEWKTNCAEDDEEVVEEAMPSDD